MNQEYKILPRSKVEKLLIDFIEQPNATGRFQDA